MSIFSSNTYLLDYKSHSQPAELEFLTQDQVRSTADYAEPGEFGEFREFFSTDLEHKISLTLLTNDQGYTAKVFSLDGNGQLEKKSAAEIYEGSATQEDVDNLAELGRLISKLNPTQALCYGIAPIKEARLVTKEVLRSGQAQNVIARDRSHFSFRTGLPGILMLDCDQREGHPPKDWKEIDEIISGIVPDWSQTQRLWRPSSSAFLYCPDGKELIGVGGWRCYVVVDDASAIPHVGAFIYQKLWDEGHGYIKISKSGQVLDRTLIDASVWQPERVDFAAEPVLKDGITRCVPEPILIGETRYLKTANLKAELSLNEWRLTSEKVRDEKAAVKDQCKKIRDEFVEQQASTLKQKSPDATEKQLRDQLVRAIERRTLGAEYVLYRADGSTITVGEILADPERWHEARFADPVEPDYHNDRRVAYANLKPKSGSDPYIWSHAHGGQLYKLASANNRQYPKQPSVRVKDREGVGLDAEVFHRIHIAKPNSLDFQKLKELCNVQIGSDVTPVQLAQFIETGRIAVAELMQCCIANNNGSSDDPYIQDLINLAQRKSSDGLTEREIGTELGKIAGIHRTNKTDASKDFQAIQQQAAMTARTMHAAILSDEDTGLIEPLRDFARDFAIINTDGRAMIIKVAAPKFSQALMTEESFELLHRNEWFEVIDDKGNKKTVYPAKEFVKKPPRETRVFHGGLVFRPAGTVPEDQYNLYRGMKIEPNSSGSYSLFEDLILNVWASGNAELAKWLLEWFMHIIAHPGDKIGTSIAIRGQYGDGKSIVFEQLMEPILGNMLLRVSNQKMILGDFNDSLQGKLLTVLEEAAFAGDKAAFDKLKEIITGKTVHINAKFKAPVTLDNYSRLVVISNHDHFLHLQPKDRRYTVLESTSAWSDKTKFEQLVDQWNNGGAARFVHDSLNHEFRKIENSSQLVINRKITTETETEQVSHSRSPLDNCIVGFLLWGDITLVKRDTPVLIDADTNSVIGPWHLDEKLEVEVQLLKQAVSVWLASTNHKGGTNGLALHAMRETLEKFVGPIERIRSKSAADRWTGKRKQLPTVYSLPTRRASIEHARKNNLITKEEYETAIGSALTVIDNECPNLEDVITSHTGSDDVWGVPSRIGGNRDDMRKRFAEFE
ncbi:MAG: primase-helicase family protein [Hyphomicrobiaceae bacterium]